MLRALTISVILCVAVSAVMAQKAGGVTGYCLMRAYDVNKFAGSGGMVSAKIIITYETGDQEIIPLDAFNDKTEPDNLKVIVATLNKLKQKGYILMSANSTGDQGNMVTDYVLLKQSY